MAVQGFSSALKLTDLDDFINPSQVHQMTRSRVLGVVFICSVMRVNILVEPQNADTFGIGTIETCPERCPYFRGELIHTCIALGHRKLLRCHRFSFRGSTVHIIFLKHKLLRDRAPR